MGPGDKSFVVAASSPEEKTKWMDDIQNAINRAVNEVSASSVVVGMKRAPLVLLNRPEFWD